MLGAARFQRLLGARAMLATTTVHAGLPGDAPHAIKQYFVVNHDLGMGRGKVAGQVAHACCTITRELERDHMLHYPSPPHVLDYKTWLKEGMAKIVLRASAAELEEIAKLPGATSVRDQGRTQIPAGSLTVVGFRPGPPMDAMRAFKLL